MGDYLIRTPNRVGWRRAAEGGGLSSAGSLIMCGALRRTLLQGLNGAMADQAPQIHTKAGQALPSHLPCSSSLSLQHMQPYR